MRVYFVLANGQEESEEMPCFGATGRVDWKGCNNKLRESINKHSYNLNITGSAAQQSCQDRWRYSANKQVTHIRLRDDCFKYLFHKRYSNVMDYVVHRSPWAPLFDKTAKEIQDQNYIDLRVDVLPSEIQTTLHIWFRDCFSRTHFPETFDYLSSQLGNEHLAFILSVIFPSLHIGSTDSRIGCEGIKSELCLDFWLNPDLSKLKVIPYTMREVHGYVMNVTKVWYNMNFKATAGQLRDALTYASGSYEVKGLFGKFQMTGVKDPVSVIKKFFLKKGIEL